MGYFCCSSRSASHLSSTRVLHSSNWHSCQMCHALEPAAFTFASQSNVSSVGTVFPAGGSVCLTNPPGLECRIRPRAPPKDWNLKACAIWSTAADLESSSSVLWIFERAHRPAKPRAARKSRRRRRSRFLLYLRAIDALLDPSVWGQQVIVLARGRCTVGVVAGAIVHDMQGLSDGVYGEPVAR